MCNSPESYNHKNDSTIACSCLYTVCINIYVCISNPLQNALRARSVGTNEYRKRANLWRVKPHGKRKNDFDLLNYRGIDDSIVINRFESNFFEVIPSRSEAHIYIQHRTT